MVHEMAESIQTELQREARTEYALSLKQPWAALVVRGLKTVEIRRWPTARRGRILIHAARLADTRPETLKHITPELKPLTELQGGILGSVELTDCIAYRDLPTFVADQKWHYNEPSWYEPPVLYGFRFAEPKVLPFQAYPGWFRFFRVQFVDGIVKQPDAAAKHDKS
jgi:hypothetical protein